ATDPVERAAALNFHTSVGVSCYLLLWARILWRVVVGHPAPNERQRGLFFKLGKWIHYILLVALGCMLLSGPAMAWASGTDIVVFDWFVIPAAIDPLFTVRDALHIVHRSCAIVMFIGIVLHLGGVYKHTAFNHDGTFTRIILPSKE
ncbi:MAG: cytochrome b/b6 domain-containing protein, partial [Gammaproteobacteria bacterium]